MKMLQNQKPVMRCGTTDYDSFDEILYMEGVAPLSAKRQRSFIMNIYKSFGIYRITNIQNGKSYIGKTGMNFGDRWDCHRAQINGG